jgi:hypothetical protein
VSDAGIRAAFAELQRQASDGRYDAPYVGLDNAPTDVVVDGRVDIVALVAAIEVAQPAPPHEFRPLLEDRTGEIH